MGYKAKNWSEGSEMDKGSCGAAAWGVQSDGEVNVSYRCLYNVKTIENECN